MKFFLPIIFLLGISRNVLGKGIRRERSNIEDELSYEELMNMNVYCYPSDSCAENRTDDSPFPEFRGQCSCHSQCWEYGTCCIDSPHRSKPPTHECVETRLNSYYMVHRCPDNTHPDSIWRIHCERELEKIDDILMISPVTSLNTSRTYKNYYCFRCHETTDNYVSWNLNVKSIIVGAPKNAIIHSVVYNQTQRNWVAILDESHAPIPVFLSFEFPYKMRPEPPEPRLCSHNVLVRDCPRCADESLRAKCLAYMAIVRIKTKNMKFKNVHCALCNNVKLHDILPCNHTYGASYYCNMDMDDTKEGFEPAEKCFETEDVPETCKSEYDVWSRHSKVCKKTSCPDPGDVPKNDICVKP